MRPLTPTMRVGATGLPSSGSPRDRDRLQASASVPTTARGTVKRIPRGRHKTHPSRRARPIRGEERAASEPAQQRPAFSDERVRAVTRTALTLRPLVVLPPDDRHRRAWSVAPRAGVAATSRARAAGETNGDHGRLVSRSAISLANRRGGRGATRARRKESVPRCSARRDLRGVPYDVALF